MQSSFRFGQNIINGIGHFQSFADLGIGVSSLKRQQLAPWLELFFEVYAKK
jgi:hypothetical protein